MKSEAFLFMGGALDQWFSTRVDLAPPFAFLPPKGTFDSVWRHFLVVIARVCYWHLLGRGQGCCWVSCSAQDRPRPPSQQKSIWSKMSIEPRNPELNQMALKTSCPLLIWNHLTILVPSSTGRVKWGRCWLLWLCLSSLSRRWSMPWIPFLLSVIDFLSVSGSQALEPGCVGGVLSGWVRRWRSRSISHLPEMCL